MQVNVDSLPEQSQKLLHNVKQEKVFPEHTRQQVVIITH